VQILILGLKILAIAVLAGFGVGGIVSGSRMEDSPLIGVGVFLLVIALLLWQVWFWRRD
jgi:hypothetical protein